MGWRKKVTSLIKNQFFGGSYKILIIKVAKVPFFLRPQKEPKGETMEYNIGDIVRTKKTHPCGCKLWEITRVGVDFKLKCTNCGHVFIMPRGKALKAITKKEQ